MKWMFFFFAFANKQKIERPYILGCDENIRIYLTHAHKLNNKKKNAEKKNW